MTALLGFLDGQPLDRAELDRRLAALRHGPRSSALPAPGSAEDRQLTRWVAQVLLTEALCTAEAAARGLDVEAAPPIHLDQRAAVELGSITAAAFERCAAVRAVYQAVTTDVPAITAPQTPPARAEWHLSTPDGDFHATLESLPARLAEAVAKARIGDRLTVDGHTVTVVGVRGREPNRAATDADADRRLAFVRWLDHARSHRLRHVPGLEHPGDPSQPDNHHRH